MGSLMLMGHGGGPAAAGPFDPTTISGLTQWLKADAGTWQDSALTTAATTDGTTVGGWVDQSAGVHNATQNTAANKPTLKLNQINSKPALLFNGTSNNFTINIGTPTAVTVFAVLKLVSTTNRSAIYGHPGNSYYCSIENADANFVVRGVGGGFGNPCGTVGTTAYHAHCFDATAGTSHHFLDSNTADGVGNGTGSFTWVRIGNDSFPTYISAYICELLLYTTVLAGPDRGNVMNYLGTRYAITIS